MATTHPQKTTDKDGVTRPGEKYPRPWVELADGRTMTFKEWFDAGRPE